MESIIGAVGGMGLFTKIEFEFADTQPLFKLVTVKVYELTGKPEKDVVSPIPVWVKVLAGEFPYAVMVHPPELGKFEMGTDPVARAQVGWVTIPANIKLPDNQQDRDMIARELLVKFQMSRSHPMVDLRKAYEKFS